MSEQIEKIAKEISSALFDIAGTLILSKIIQMDKDNPTSLGLSKHNTYIKDADLATLQNNIYYTNGLDFFSDDDEQLFLKAIELAKKNKYWYVGSRVSKEELPTGQPKFDVVIIDDQDKPETLPEKLPTEKQVLDSELKKFNLADTEIAKLKQQYKDLKITGIDDLEGYKAVDDAIKIVAKKRTGVEGVRKDVKDFYLKTGKAIDAEAKRLTVSLLDIETPLKNKKQAIDDELKNIEAAAEKKKQETLTFRIGEFAKYAYACDVTALKEMTEETFNVELEYAKSEWQKEFDKKEKLAADALQLEAEKKKLADEKADFEKQKVELTGKTEVHIPEENKTYTTIFDHSSAPNMGVKVEEESAVKSMMDVKDPFDDMTDVKDFMEKPEPLKNIDLVGLTAICEEYLNFLNDDENYHEGNNYDHLIYGKALEAIYGPKVFDYINGRRL